MFTKKATTKVSTSAVSNPEETSVTEVTLTNTAYSIYKSPVNGRWMMATVKYNPLTGDSGEVESFEADMDRESAIDKFKMAVGPMLFEN